MTADCISFLRHRALIERQMGVNQLNSGSEAGKWRLDRADMYDKCADLIIELEHKKND